MRLRFCPSRGWAPSGDAHVMSSLQALCVGQAHSFRQTRTCMQVSGFVALKAWRGGGAHMHQGPLADSVLTFGFSIG